jgi:hypothetical protein
MTDIQGDFFTGATHETINISRTNYPNWEKFIQLLFWLGMDLRPNFNKIG